MCSKFVRNELLTLWSRLFFPIRKCAACDPDKNNDAWSSGASEDHLAAEVWGFTQTAAVRRYSPWRSRPPAWLWVSPVLVWSWCSGNTGETGPAGQWYTVMVCSKELFLTLKPLFENSNPSIPHYGSPKECFLLRSFLHIVIVNKTRHFST